MFKKISYLFVLFVVSAFLSGCMVAESKYLMKEAETVSLTKKLQELQQKHETLIVENTVLKAQLDKLQNNFSDLKSEKEKLSADRDELDRVLKSKSDDLSKTISDLRGQNASLDLQNKNLQQEIGNLKKSKEQEVQAVSKTYDDLLKEMKGEVAKGQIMLTELKGKLTLDVVDEILFDSGVAEIKSQGLAVLQRVVEILKKVNDKAIRVEGHTDDRKIGGALVKKYATNWELSAARAINVARYLQNQGVDPVILSAAAFGEYKPVADNATPEGRAKNRRIAIVLLPKD